MPRANRTPARANRSENKKEEDEVLGDSIFRNKFNQSEIILITKFLESKRLSVF